MRHKARLPAKARVHEHRGSSLVSGVQVSPARLEELKDWQVLGLPARRPHERCDLTDKGDCQVAIRGEREVRGWEVRTPFSSLWFTLHLAATHRWTRLKSPGCTSEAWPGEEGSTADGSSLEVGGFGRTAFEGHERGRGLRWLEMHRDRGCCFLVGFVLAHAMLRTGAV